MALLKEDNSYTHVIAIDFGTGASGYDLINVDMLLRQEILIKTERYEYKYLVHVMEVMIKRHPRRFYLIMKVISLTLALMLFKNTQRSLRMEIRLSSFRMYKLFNVV